ncbi:MAG: aspartate carbamoyltransferase regulatory subunit [Burkholderiales bacterium]|jgi:aspartate carbamoyltransferase regulatory subunit|nr:aspartate carbamoyltransferase regulatory subunit [Burkholderiales bacterium]
MKKHIADLENGINIDHIPHGNALFIIQTLNLFSSDKQVGVGLNLPSERLGHKDLIKVADYNLSDKEQDAISLFAPGATLSVIEEYKVISKATLELPKEISNLIICPNPRCVSKQYKSKFTTYKDRKSNIKVRCHYCEQEFLLDSIKEYNI